jgi:hypothetical protein
MVPVLTSLNGGALLDMRLELLIESHALRAGLIVGDAQNLL